MEGSGFGEGHWQLLLSQSSGELQAYPLLLLRAESPTLHSHSPNHCRIHLLLSDQESEQASFT